MGGHMHLSKLIDLSLKCALLSCMGGIPPRSLIWKKKQEEPEEVGEACGCRGVGILSKRRGHQPPKGAQYLRGSEEPHIQGQEEAGDQEEIAQEGEHYRGVWGRCPRYSGGEAPAGPDHSGGIKEAREAVQDLNNGEKSTLGTPRCSHTTDAHSPTAPWQSLLGRLRALLQPAPEGLRHWAAPWDTRRGPGGGGLD